MPLRITPTPHIILIIADSGSHAFLLELPRPLCPLVTHPETYGRDYRLGRLPSEAPVARGVPSKPLDRAADLIEPAFDAFTEGAADSESTSELLALAEEHAEVAGFLRHVFADLLGGADPNVRMGHEESWFEPARALLRRIPGPHRATCAPPSSRTTSATATAP